MAQGNSSSNWLIKILGSAALAGLVAIIALISQVVSSRNNDIASKTLQANQAIQIAKQDTQITISEQQLNVYRDIETLQASTSKSDPTAIAAATRVAELESTAVALETAQASAKATALLSSNVLTFVRKVDAPAPSPRNFQITLATGEIIVGQCWEFITQGQHYGNGVAFLLRGPYQFDFTVSDGWFAIYKNASFDDGESLLRGQIDTFRTPPTIVRLP